VRLTLQKGNSRSRHPLRSQKEFEQSLSNTHRALCPEGTICPSAVYLPVQLPNIFLGASGKLTPASGSAQQESAAGRSDGHQPPHNEDKDTPHLNIIPRQPSWKFYCSS